jgi:CheY-like chemotaxis protein
MLRITLMSEGFTVALAGDGQQALAALEDVEPDLVVLDLQMPVMDGRSFYRAFRQRGYQTPVLVLSAYNAEGAQQELGAEAFLGKPCDPDEFSQLVHVLLQTPASQQP